MGCDIHLFTERKRNINSKEKWVNIDHFKYNPYYSKENDCERELQIVSVYDSRNYNLFSALANVRNYSNNNYICEPKGLPDDCSEIVLSQSEYWGCDGHSHSWFTLKELKDFIEKNPKTKHSGMMTPENAKLVDNGQMPNSWCKSTNMENYVYREWEFRNDVFDYLIEKVEERKKEDFWIFDDKDHSEYDEEIRIVFWFDN